MYILFVCYAPNQHLTAFPCLLISFLYEMTFSCCCNILSSILLFAVCFPMYHRDMSDRIYTAILMFRLRYRSIAIQSHWTEGWHAGLQCQCRCPELANTQSLLYVYDGHAPAGAFGPCWCGTFLKGMATTCMDVKHIVL